VDAARLHLHHLLDRLGGYRHLVLSAVSARPELVPVLVDSEVAHGYPRAATLLAQLAAGAASGSIPNQGSSAGARSGPVIDLTARETDVLNELALGGSYTDIAITLYITENTVKTHLASLYRKLGANRRADALRAARGAGLIGR
jgi:DNA-binding CsgD family transcriptional regulator